MVYCCVSNLILIWYRIYKIWYIYIYITVGGSNHLEKYESQWEVWYPIYYGKMFETTNQWYTRYNMVAYIPKKTLAETMKLNVVPKKLIHQHCQCQTSLKKRGLVWWLSRLSTCQVPVPLADTGVSGWILLIICVSISKEMFPRPQSSTRI